MRNNIFIDRTLFKRYVPKAGKSGKIYYTTSKWVDNKKMMQIIEILLARIRNSKKVSYGMWKLRKIKKYKWISTTNNALREIWNKEEKSFKSKRKI